MFNKLPKSQPITIEFNDLSYTVPAPMQKGKVKKDRLTILDGVTGVFRPGQLTAIMGPSGAGKSTLLNVLAGYKVRDVKGDILVNGTARSLQTFRKIQAYIMQDDFLLPYLSVDEAMMAAANLKLGRGGLDSNSCSSCVALLKTLAEGGRTIICTIHQPSSRLFQQFDQLYILASGSCIYRGARPNLVPALAAAGLQCPGFHNPADFVMEAASGEYGEWTDRLVAASKNGRCLTWEKVTDPPEVTESTQADQHCHTVDETDFAVGKMNGHATPPSKNSTHQLQNGSAQGKNGVQRNGHLPTESPSAHPPNGECPHPAEPPPYEPAAGAQLNGASLPAAGAPVSSQDGDGGEVGCTSLLLRHKHPAPMSELCQRLDEDVGGQRLYQRLDSGRELYRTSTVTQFMVLLKRTCQSIVRDRMLTMARLVSHILFGVLIGSLYFDIGNEAKDVYNNAAQLFFALMFVLFSALMPTILTFPCEMAVFRKEYLNCWYSMKSYYIAKTLADLPFQIVFPLIYDVIVYYMTSQPNELDRFLMFCLMTVLTSLVAQSVGLVIGACCDIQLAVFLGPVTMIPIILFSGFFLTLNAIPVYLSWISYLSYARYSFEGLMLAVYGNGRGDMHCSQPYCHFRSPEKFLKEMDMLDSSYWVDVAVLAGMTVGLRLLGYFVLRWKLRMER
ncbi:ATP-binding cassette sub-family G member 4 [Amphibalanus amphitrite]|uniref:ATP-binding cassette sub-family G member 4 n=1 Tax=Amphibalanus amphitrite TaxID=1232801 RepID=A0A6A4WH59_AMPAM|nr:ATP-binding cassette sub-family G member 4 [Amphibalanus amphitrite]